MTETYHHPDTVMRLPVLPEVGAAEPSKPLMSDTPPVSDPPVPAPAEGDSIDRSPVSNENHIASDEPTTAPAAVASADPLHAVQQKLVEGKVIAALQTVYDPEIPVNIYELGLIYAIEVDPDNAVRVRMTLTAPTCPVAGSLPGEVETKIQAIPEVKSAAVELVWEPPWSRDCMSEAAQLQLGLM